MNTVESALMHKKEELDSMKAPAEMEALLRQALKGRKRHVVYKPAAAILIAALLITYSFDSLAYYGKKFTGYDQIAVGSLKQLNEEGRGQEINKSCTFSNGVEVIIDGIMFDENELVAFYKVHSSGKLQDILNYNLPRLHVSGLKPGGYNFTGGQGKIADEQNMNFMDTMEPPAFYEKWMRMDVELIIDKRTEIRSIDFTLDRNQAMKRTTRMDLSAVASLGDYKISFDRLTASTMSTVLEGRIVPATDAGLKTFNAETTEASMEIPQLRFDIISDSGKVSQFYGGQSSSNNDISFSSTSDALPKDFKTLQIRDIRLETMKLVDKTVDAGPDTKDIKICYDLILKRVYQDGDEIFAVVSSSGIPVMGLFEGDKQLEQVNPEALDLEAKSENPVERVYMFKGTGDNLKLQIKYIRYSTFSPDTIDIPVK